MDDGWTLDELAQRVAEALAADGVRAPNGRVREVPDPRAIRWYATIGLVDRPRFGRGRAARYDSRHLRQLMAVKRLQAQGRSLAEIQAELAGATDAVLDRAARVPDELLAETAGDRPAARDRFWASPTAPASPAASPATEPAAGSASTPRPALAISYLVPLTGGVTLALPAAPDADELAAIHAAAAPLLHLLADRGLTTLEGVRDDQRAH